MKKILLSLVMMCCSLCSNAQTYNLDVNGDGQTTLADVTFLVNYLLGRVCAVSLDQNSITLNLDDNYTCTLTATIFPATASNATVIWSSSNTDVATVSSKGKVVAVDCGTAIITCRAKDSSGAKATCTVTVEEPDTKEYVDLGLPSGTLWATCNVGSKSPEDYGDYFSWGETEGYNNGKRWFGWYNSGYKYCNGSSTTLTKYNYSSSYGSVDNRAELDVEDDAAYVNWGSDWCMPSETQMEELINSRYTTSAWTTMNGINGRLITSLVNGNSIFLPAPGNYDGNVFSNNGTYGYYWSRTLYTDNRPDCAWKLTLNSDNIETGNGGRYFGRSVRPVYSTNAERIKVSSITLNCTSAFLYTGENYTLTATILPEDAFTKTYTWSSSDESVATVSADGVITSVAEGTATITCAANDGSGVTATCTVTVEEPGGYANGYAYIDLGLPSGTLWATCNVGAKDSKDYGEHFAFGETSPQSDNTYDWSTYNWCSGSSTTLTKYCTISNCGAVDNLTELETSDDAAYVNWGSEWRMPTSTQCIELVNSSYVTRTWTTLNNVCGLLITSLTNGNTVFLPAAGCCNGGALNSLGSQGNYWSRSLLSTTNPSYYAWRLSFDSSSIDTTHGYYRSYGRSIRPVLNK